MVLLIWRPWASGDDPSVSAFVAPTPVVAGATAAPAMAPRVPAAPPARDVRRLATRAAALPGGYFEQRATAADTGCNY